MPDVNLSFLRKRESRPSSLRQSKVKIEVKIQLSHTLSNDASPGEFGKAL